MINISFLFMIHSVVEKRVLPTLVLSPFQVAWSVLCTKFRVHPKKPLAVAHYDDPVLE